MSVAHAPLNPKPDTGMDERRRSHMVAIRMAHWRSGSSTSETTSVLRKLRNDLAGISQSTEDSFLALGEGLMELQAGAREVAGQTAAVCEQMSSDEGSLSVLDDLFKGQDPKGQEQGIAERMRELEENATAIRQAIRSLEPVADIFYVLGIRTRVESVCLNGGGAAFSDLADAVTGLSRRIRDQIGASARSAALLRDTAVQAAEELQKTTQLYEQNLGPLARQATDESIKIKEQQNRVCSATRQLSERFERMSHAIGNVVAASQVHDIVRQQVDHVLKALDEWDARGASETNRAEIAHLLTAQLENSRSTFQCGLEEVQAALAEIERNIGEVTEEAARAMGLSNFGEGSFLSVLKADLASVLAILERNQVADSHLEAAADGVHRQVDEIAKTVADVHAISMHMQHIALNATIQAGWLDANGAALRIVANTIRDHAREADRTYDTLETRFRTTREITSALRDAITRRRGSTVQVEGLQRCIASLNSVQERAHRDYTRTLALTTRLKSQIRETVAAFGTQNECLEILAAAIAVLSELSAGRASEPVHLNHIKTSYTMQSERIVHQTIHGVEHGAAEEESNVEFF